MTTTSTFDPRPCLKKLNGKDYLEVVYRLQWLRAEHPDATITTKLEHLDWEAGYAVFHARVEIPGSGIAEGTGSETRQGFPAGWLEKGETVAVGRALAMLGYGTAFALTDFEEGHLADAPVDTPAAHQTTTATPAPATGQRPRPISTGLATPAQLRLIHTTASRDLRITEEELEERCQGQYGTIPVRLTVREASELIDQMKREAKAG